MKNKTIKDVHREVGEPMAPAHRYDPHAKKIYDVETHRHLLKVRDDMAAGRGIWIPKINPTPNVKK